MLTSRSRINILGVCGTGLTLLNEYVRFFEMLAALTVRADIYLQRQRWSIFLLKRL
jgi:hypothetical protein